MPECLSHHTEIFQVASLSIPGRRPERAESAASVSIDVLYQLAPLRSPKSDRLLAQHNMVNPVYQPSRRDSPGSTRCLPKSTQSITGVVRSCFANRCAVRCESVAPEYGTGSPFTKKFRAPAGFLKQAVIYLTAHFKP